MFAKFSEIKIGNGKDYAQNPTGRQKHSESCMNIFQTMVLEIHKLVTIIEAAYDIIYLVL